MIPYFVTIGAVQYVAIDAIHARIGDKVAEHSYRPAHKDTQDNGVYTVTGIEGDNIITAKGTAQRCKWHLLVSYGIKPEYTEYVKIYYREKKTTNGCMTLQEYCLFHRRQSASKLKYIIDYNNH